MSNVTPHPVPGAVVPLLGIGGWCLQADFLDVGDRYVSAEVSPVAEEGPAYLTDGKGLVNLGVREQAPAAPAAGPCCRSCGTRNDADARFCDSCGTAMA